MRRRSHGTALIQSFLVAVALSMTASCSKEPDRPPYVAGTPFDAANPFPDASEVRLFVDDAYDSDYNPTWTHPEGIQLTADQRRQFEGTLSVISAEGQSLAACFNPHHFFRYYDAKGKQVGEIAACFCCKRVELTPASRLVIGKDELFQMDFAKLATLVTSLGERTNVGCYSD